MKLSDRQAAALAALAELGCPASGPALAQRMTASGRQTSNAAAHQAASGLVRKGLAIKGYPAGAPAIRYQLTAEGRQAADTIDIDQAERDRRAAARLAAATAEYWGTT